MAESGDKIAALFVEKKGVYSDHADIDLWDITRDARNYNGPYKVIAHPPCERWGFSSNGGPKGKASGKFKAGNDQGCFASALSSVRRFGGVIEHPECSKAYDWFGIKRPPYHGGWIKADVFGGYTCCVDQGHYGHIAQKTTWLYALGVSLPELIWGRCKGKIWLGTGFNKPGEYQKAKREGRLPPVLYVPLSVRKATPIPFRDLLISIVKGK